jgi:hypothetical protein
MKYLSRVAFAIVLSLTFIACSNEAEENNNLQERVSSKQLEIVGIEHNQRLKETFDFLTENKKILSKSSKIEKQEILEGFLISKINSNTKYDKRFNEFTVKYTRDIFINLKNKSKLSFENKTNELAYELSKKETFFLTELQNILTTSTTLNQINEKIDNLNIEIENDAELNNEQLILLFSATQTAKYSCNYWAYEMENWNNLNSKEAGKLSQKCGEPGCYTDTVGTIAGADVAGAIGGAVGAVAVNVIVGPGQVAYAGAIIGTAVAGSVGAAVLEFFSWWNS